MICCALLYLMKCSRPVEAVAFFSERRLLGESVVSLLILRIWFGIAGCRNPFALPILNFYRHIVVSKQWNFIEKPPSYFLDSIRMNTIPNFKVLGGCGELLFVDSQPPSLNPWFAIYQRGRRIFLSQPLVYALVIELLTFETERYQRRWSGCLWLQKYFYQWRYSSRILSP